jgi:hypothetical protein
VVIVQVVLAWVLVALCGVLGYRFAARARRVFGVSPWRIPPLLWALVCVFVPIIGNLLETVALLTTRRPPLGGEWGPGLFRDTTVDGRPPVVPTTARPAGPQGGAPEVPPAVPTLSEAQFGERRLPGPAGWRPADAGERSAGFPPLFGWYPDPTGRHELRYWDGRMWSDSVSDGPERSSDPVD